MKIRSDFVTNSSSSSYVTISIKSRTFSDIIKRFEDEFKEEFGLPGGVLGQTWLQTEGVEISFDDMQDRYPYDYDFLYYLTHYISTKEDIVNFLSGFYSGSTRYIEKINSDDRWGEDSDADWDAKYADYSIEESQKHRDLDRYEEYKEQIDKLFAQELIRNKDSIEADLEYFEYTSGNQGWGDSGISYIGSGVLEDVISADYGLEILTFIAKEKGCSVEELEVKDYYDYVKEKQTIDSGEKIIYDKTDESTETKLKQESIFNLT